MKRQLSKKGKLIIRIITIIAVLILVAVWGLMCYIAVNTVDYAGNYEPNAGTRFIAHRGYSDKYYQNTLPAFRAAADESFFQGVETDVRMTADGVYVCSHDDNPFEDKSILISKSNFDEIKNLPLDMSLANENVDLTQEYRIASLADYLKVVSGAQKIAFIEIKQEFTREQTKDLASFVFKYIAARRTYFCGFLKEQIDYIYKDFGYVNIELFTKSKVKAYFYGQMGYNVGVRYDQVKGKKPVERAHDKDCFFGVWTVADEETAREMIGYGVDYITCDGVLDI